jgi:hypothetical protein
VLLLRACWLLPTTCLLSLAGFCGPPRAPDLWGLITVTSQPTGRQQQAGGSCSRGSSGSSSSGW